MKQLAYIILIGLALCAGNAMSAPVALTDATGALLRLPAPASRIVALAPSLTELAFAAGAGGKVVAVSAFSDYPEAAKALPQVADYASVSFEKILALKPDLVLAWKSGTKDSDIARLRALGMAVFVIDIARTSDIAPALASIGVIAGTEPIAAGAAVAFADQLGALKQRQAGKKPVSVFFEISRTPLMTINRSHAIDEVITLCGGRNMFADAATLVLQPSMETLLAKQPEAILYAAAREDKGANPYRQLRAGKSKRVYQIDADTILRPGPRLIRGVFQVCAALDKARLPAGK